VISAASLCGLLTTIAFLRQHLGEEVDSAYTRFGVSIAALAVTTFLTLRQKRSAAERERSERRYGAIFHAAGFAAWESDWSEARQYIMRTGAGRMDDLETWLLSHPEIVREAARRAVIQDVNQAAIRLFDATSAEELIREGVVGRYPEEAEQGFARILAELMSGREMVEAEVPLATVTGRKLDTILRITLVPDGEPWSRALVMAFDETERREARARLEQVSTELAHAARVSVLGQLAASVAHEVNQPLTAIVAYGKSATRWLDRQSPDVAEARNCLDKIIANGTRAAGVIGRIRSLARKVPPRTEPLDMADLIRETVALLAHETKSADTIVRTVLKAVPAPLGDRVQVQQVLVNLLLNAVQAMLSVADRERRITISLDAEDGFVRVEVRDRGPGIEDFDKIFAPFFTTKQDGMGMGLSISRSIVEAQGGRLFAKNNADRGAAISFTLPVAQPQALAKAEMQTSV
jgi:C4-dicarboxylate-specific signal transduction histidine kinase